MSSELPLIIVLTFACMWCILLKFMIGSDVRTSWSDSTVFKKFLVEANCACVNPPSKVLTPANVRL